jgi:hypothetical protein
MPSINLPDDLYQYFGQFGHRDESWSDTFARVAEYVDEPAAMDDRAERRTTYDAQTVRDTDDRGPIDGLADGTPVRHRFQQGDHAGEELTSEIQNGYIVYEGEKLYPSPAARQTDMDFRGEDADHNHNGWRWWSYYDEQTDEWRQLNTIR